MHIRRNTALALGALVLAVPALTSCGFNYATDRDYTPATGVNNRDASVDVLGAVIVSAQDDSGTFIASLANNDASATASFDALAGGAGNTIQAESFSPIEIPKGGLVNLATDGGIPVSGTFQAGQFVPVTVSFAGGEKVTLNIPVVLDDGYYEGLDISGGATDGATDGPTDGPTDGATETTTE